MCRVVDHGRLGRCCPRRERSLQTPRSRPFFCRRPTPLLPPSITPQCGHVDSGKSTTTGRLLFELGGIPERELEKLKEEAAALGKSSFAFAFYMDRQKEERERGVTIACTTKEFFTEKWHYTIIDAPGECGAGSWGQSLLQVWETVNRQAC